MNEIQELYLQLIERSSFNEFDGERVVRDLRNHPDLWDATLMTRSDIGIILRDLPEGGNNVDMLYLATTRERLPALRRLVQPWKADEVAVDEMDFGGYFPDKVCLVLWWD